MNDQARLLDGSFSQGLETLTQLARHAGFTVELGKLIRLPGGVDRAIRALRKEFLEAKGDANESAPADKDEEYRVSCTYLNDNRRLATVEKNFLVVQGEHVVRDFLTRTIDRKALPRIGRHQYRPATQMELYEFYRAHPELLQRYWIVAVGSMDGMSYDGPLTGAPIRQLFGRFVRFSRLPYDIRVLFVRE